MYAEVDMNQEYRNLLCAPDSSGIGRLVPLPVIDVYKNVMDELTSVFSGNPEPDKIVRYCEDIIEKSFSLDYADLYLCNRAFGSFDSGTARHSFSVYCLFCDVLFYIRKQEKTDLFYNLFKRKGSAVNFSSGQIRKYAMGLSFTISAKFASRFPFWINREA